MDKIKLILGASILLIVSGQVNASLIYGLTDNAGLTHSFDLLTDETLVTGDSTFNGPSGLAYNDGLLYGLNNNGGLIHSFNISTGESLVVGDSTFNGPSGLAIAVSPVPAPPALLLFLTGLIGLIGFNKRRNAA